MMANKRDKLLDFIRFVIVPGLVDRYDKEELKAKLARAPRKSPRKRKKQAQQTTDK